MHPDPNWPRREQWTPLLDACSALQRANAEAGPLLSPIDVSDTTPQLHATWWDGPSITLVPPFNPSPQELLHLLTTAAPDAQVIPTLPGHETEWWAPPAEAPPRVRYAWLLDQLSGDSAYFAMHSLRLLAVSADCDEQTAQVAVERCETHTVVLARFPLLSGDELIHAQDYIVTWILNSSPKAFVASGTRWGRPAYRLDLPS